MRPTGDAVAVGVLTVLLLFIAVNLQAGWVYAVDALLIGLLVASGVSAGLGVRGLVAERTMPREAFEGDPVTVTLRLQARRGRRYFIAMRDAVPGLDPGTVRIAVCDARRPVAQSYQTVARRRGVFRVEMLDVRSSGLAGLFTFRRRLTAPGAITVFPRYWTLAAFSLPGRAAVESTSMPRPDRNGLEVAGVREFRDGDSLRHVHWRSTARRGTLVVREFEHETAEPVALIIDTRAEPYTRDRSGEAFEDLVRVAASIAHMVTRSGRPIQLIGADGAQVTTAIAGWSEALHWLARVQPNGRLSPLDGYRSAASSGMPVVLCSADLDAAAVLIRHDIPLAAVLVDVASYTTGDESKDPAAGEMLLEALGVPVAVVRRGVEVGTCLASLSR